MFMLPSNKMSIVINTPTSNIGRALAARLLDAGERVTVLSRDKKKVDELLCRGARVVEGSFRGAVPPRQGARGRGGAVLAHPAAGAADYYAWATKCAKQGPLGRRGGRDHLLGARRAGEVRRGHARPSPRRHEGHGHARLRRRDHHRTVRRVPRGPLGSGRAAHARHDDPHDARRARADHARTRDPRQALTFAHTPIHSFTPAHTPILLHHRPAVHLSARLTRTMVIGRCSGSFEEERAEVLGLKDDKASSERE
jgi:hypothetical protein